MLKSRRVPNVAKSHVRPFRTRMISKARKASRSSVVKSERDPARTAIYAYERPLQEFNEALLGNSRATLLRGRSSRRSRRHIGRS